MSGQLPEQPEQPFTRTGNRSDRNGNEDTQQQDVWAELFGIVQGLGDTVSLALQAFTPSDDKAVSAITKKRLALRSLHGLKHSQTSIEALAEHLKALQAASQTWQRSMMYASKSQQELMEQIESTTQELHTTSERLRAVEAQRLSAVREAELLRARSEQQEAAIKDATSTLKHKEEELETLQFSLHELQASSTAAQQSADRLQQAAAEAEGRARVAASTLDEAKAEAAKAQGLAERHQQVVAKLTADNLVFLMQLKKAEADLATANQERAQLRLAAEQQRGPWFDQVRAGVEERVRQALQRSQELEARLERLEAEHGARIEAMRAQQDRLEEQVATARQHAHGLQGRLDAAAQAKDRAEGLCTAAEAAAREMRRELDALAAENRVLLESVRSMRQECTERWVTEQSALGRVEGLEQRIGELQQALSQQIAQVTALQRQLDTQTGVNRQLMARKEEVEWQLMAAMAKIDEGAPDQPVPLNLRVSGMLQVGGPKEHLVSGANVTAHAATGSGGGANSASAEGAAAAGGRDASAADADSRTAAASGVGLPREASGALPEQSVPQRATAAALSQVAADEPRPSLPTAESNLVVSAHAGGAATRAAPAAAPGASGPGAGWSSPPRRSRPDADAASRGWSLSLLAAEPTLLMPGEDAVTITRGPVGGGVDGRGALAAAAGISDPLLLPQPPLQLRGGSISMPGDERGAAAAGGGGDGGAGAQGLGAQQQQHAHWTSVEGASTVVSSPPSSIALSSSELGSPGGGGGSLSQLPPSVPSSRGPGAGAAAAAAAASFSIRTVSTGQRRTADGEAAAAAPAYVPGSASAARPAGQLGRRGSLHDGEDVWLPGVASSSSSDDSDFLSSAAAGVIVQHESHVSGQRGSMQTPAQQAQLNQLQQRLQLHLQGPAGAAAAGGTSGAGAGPRLESGRDMRSGGSGGGDGLPFSRQDVPSYRPVEMRPAPDARMVQARIDTRDSRNNGKGDDDVIRVRPPPQRDGGGVVIRPAIMMQSGPATLPASAGPDSSGERPVASSGALSAYGVTPVAPLASHARSEGGLRGDPGSGVFSIVKGGPQRGAAVRSGGSPLHPALSSARPDPAAGPSFLAGGSPRPASAAVAAAAADHAGPAGPVNAAPSILRESDGVAPSDMDPVPSRVQAGPPFYATGGPLTTTAVAALERWRLSGGGAGGSGHDAVPVAAAAAAPSQPPQSPLQQPQPQPQQPAAFLGSVPHSPARSAASMRSPRSPAHPAFYVVGDRGSGTPTGPGASGKSLLDAAASPRVAVSFASLVGSSNEAVAATEAALRPLAAEMETVLTAPGAAAGARVSTSAQELLGAHASGRDEHAAAEAVAAGGTAAARSRLSLQAPMHRDGQQQDAVGSQMDDSSVGGGFAAGSIAGHVWRSSISSSTGSLTHQGNGSGNGNGRSGSVKSVRFSDHDAVADDEDGMVQPLPKWRDSQEQLGAGSMGRTSLRQLSQDFSGRAVSQWSYAGGEGTPSRFSGGQRQARVPSVIVSSEGSSPYRSLGPVPHPAMPGVAAAAGLHLGGATAAPGVEGSAEAMPSKRYRSAGVATTAVPSWPAGSS